MTNDHDHDHDHYQHHHDHHDHHDGDAIAAQVTEHEVQNSVRSIPKLDTLILVKVAPFFKLEIIFIVIDYYSVQGGAFFF